jgi:hypothetical protein
MKMLKTVQASANRKTGPIAVTYRAGSADVYGTCPQSCNLCPRPAAAASSVDLEYLEALRHAVPRNGQAWTYSHFAADNFPRWSAGETVINASCDTIAEAIAAHDSGRPAVYAAPLNSGEWPQKHYGLQFVRCPAETRDDITCASCGNGRPLCARGDRDYIVVFVAHGASAKRVGDCEPGGCYASGGPTFFAWNNTRKQAPQNDAETIQRFAQSLPPGWLLRHHIAGDVGK